jgi:hypothetical protein
MSGNPQRRKFIKSILGVAVLGYAGEITSAVRKTGGLTGVGLQPGGGYEIFAALLGDYFAVSRLDSKLGYLGRLRLVEANKTASTAQTEQFTLVFRGPTGDPLAQDTYRIQHAAINKADIFLQPACSNRRGHYYQACFNLLK